MKFNIKKLTSVTLLTSMMLTTVSPLTVPAMAYERESEISENVVAEMEETVAESSIAEDFMEESTMQLIETEVGVQETEIEIPGTEVQSEEVTEQNLTASEDMTEPDEETEPEMIQEEVQTETETESETVRAETEIPDYELTEQESAANQEETTEEMSEESSEETSEETSVEEESELAQTQETEPVNLKLEKITSDEYSEIQEVKITAMNPTEEDVRLRIYFWDYDGEFVDGKQIPEEILTDACEDFEIIDCKDSNHFSVSLTKAEEEPVQAECMIHEEIMGENLTARYLEVELLSGFAFDESVSIISGIPESIVLSPVIYLSEEEMKFDKLLVSWNEKQDELDIDEEVNHDTENFETENYETETHESESEQETQEIAGETETEENAEAVDMIVTEVEEAETHEDTTEILSGEDVEIETEEVGTEELETEEADTEETETEAVVEIPEYLNEADFASKRLIVMTSDENMILESENVIGCYDNIYLIEYETVEECMAAYVYYTDVVDAVEPDAFMEIASDETGEQAKEETEESNLITALSNTEGASFHSDGKVRVIALLDTGASASENVIGRVSLIDDALEGHSHGNSMVAAITSQNPDAQILSVRVMGNDGRGTVSAIVAGMEYAMENGASIINLSLSSRKNQLNEVLEAEIQKAVSMGIIVVGAAGNNAADVMNYMPGSVSEAYIIGACNEKGVRIASSNYGSTVDYNVTADTTSEAAAKFSGCVSLAGIEGMKVNEGAVYTTDYVAVTPDVEEETDEETEKAETPDDNMTEDERSDMAGEEVDGEYPGKGSSISQTVKIWTRDIEYDCSSYNPYIEDANVIVSCISEIPEFITADGEKVQAEYICSLKENADYKWNLFVTFEFVDDRSLATEGSDLLENLMPEMVSQERNAGYGGIVPEYAGATVAGREFTVLKDDTEFDIYGLLVDYNPETFKMNNLSDDGGFDVSVPGTYIVTYEMSYFMYPEYTWFVENTVHVVEKENLEAGIYLTSTESTLMFRRDEESYYCGYGDLVKVQSSEETYTVRCIDEGYEIAFTSSSDTVTTDICELTNLEDGNKLLTVHVPDDLSETVILSMYRPGYQSAKFFTGGGWVDGEEFNIEEASVDELTEEEMKNLEETVLGKTEEDDEEYMEIAASWTTVESKKISGKVTTSAANTTNHSWVSGRMGGCNYGTAQVTAKKSAITSWIEEKGYEIDASDLKNFKVSCSSGHDYLGLWPNSSYNVTFKCYIQKKGDSYRLKITCSLNPGSDQHGNYQGFYGSKTYSDVTNGARLRVYKRFRDPAFMDVNPDRYGNLKTTFSIYPASAYNTTTKILDTTVDPESTIVLSEDEENTVYGDSDILDPGTYYVVETRRIKGCVQNTDIYGPVEISETDSGVVKLHEKVNNADYASMGSNNWIYNNPMYFNGKILTKTDDSGLPVANAIYKVEYSTAENAADFAAVKTWYLKTDESGSLSYSLDSYVDSFSYNGKTYTSDSLITNASGTLAMLPFGFLRIKEVMPPSDIYELDNNTYTIELVAKKDASGAYTIRKLVVKGNIPTSVDKLRYWKLNVEKESQASAEVLGLDAYSLAGATFAVYSDQACTKLMQLYADEKLTTKVTNNVFTTDENGKTPTYYLKAGTGSTTYYVKELTAPKGHQIAANAVPVTVTMPNDALKQKTAQFKQQYSEPYDYMEVDALVEKLSMHGSPVKGVVFKVCYFDDSSANTGKQKKTWYLVSDENGKVYLDQKHVYTGDSSLKSDGFYIDPASKKTILPIGGYATIQEIKAPAQYRIDDTIRGFATKKQTFTVQRLYNENVPCKIRLKKYDAAGKKPLAGVQFELKYVKAAEQDTSLKSTYTRLLKEGETKVLTTDKNGEICFDNLDQGTYEITETKTVSGQTLLKDKITVELPITMTKAEAEKYGNVDFARAKEDKGYSDKWFFYDCLYEITNEPQFDIPQTGGFGSWMYGYIGILALALAGGVLFFGRKRRRV